MRFRRKVLLIILQIAVLIVAVYCLSDNYGLLLRYDRYIFYPFQSLRGSIFGILWFSIGDIIYVIWGVGLLVTLIKWVSYIFRFGTYKERLAASCLNAISTILSVYLFFLLSLIS